MNRGLLLLALALSLSSPPAAAEASDGAESQAALPGSAQGSDGRLSPADERRAAAIARQTMSPFCPGRTLADCPSGYATEWRADIRDMVAQGKSAKEIQQILEARAGGNLSGSPNRDSSYGLPLFFGLLALAVLGAVFLRLRASGKEAAATRSQKDDVPGEGGKQDEKPSKSKKASNRPEAMVDEARLDAELAAEDEGPVD